MTRRLSKIRITFLTAVLMHSIPISAYGTDGQIKISQPVSPATFPIIINKAGSYVLTSNLVVLTGQNDVNAIEITVNDVTLDLNGHMIQGPHTGSPWGGTGNGIEADDRYNITIKNGRVWGFGGTGIFLNNVGEVSQVGAGHFVDRIQAANNGTSGITIHGGLITDCVANNNNLYGINAYYSTVTNCMCNNNAIGFYLMGVISNGCRASNNRTLGISAEYSNLRDCYSSSNSGDGIAIAQTGSVTNCISTNNDGDGIYAYYKCRVEGNTVNYNGRDGTGYGVSMGGSDSYAVKNLGSDNPSGDFYDGGTSNYMPLSGDNANY